MGELGQRPPGPQDVPQASRALDQSAVHPAPSNLWTLPRPTVRDRETPALVSLLSLPQTLQPSAPSPTLPGGPTHPRRSWWVSRIVQLSGRAVQEERGPWEMVRPNSGLRVFRLTSCRCPAGSFPPPSPASVQDQSSSLNPSPVIRHWELAANQTGDFCLLELRV